MRILAISHALYMGGAQISILEQLELLKEVVELKVLICKESTKEFVKKLNELGLPYKALPCEIKNRYPLMILGGAYDWITQSDVVWITDTEFLTAPIIKRIKNVPVVLHLRSYLLICHIGGLLYGMKEVCYEGCGIRRITRCKQMLNRELAKLGLIETTASALYQVIDFVKGPLDYFKWQRVVNRSAIDSADGFIAVSNFVRETYEKLLSIEDSLIEVIYNPVTYPLRYIRKFEDSEEDEGFAKDLIVYASGSSPDKGPHVLLEAVKILLNDGLDVKLEMFGCRGTWVEKYVSKLKVDRNVVCMGKESFDMLYKEMYKAKAVVMPSLWPEPFGRVPVEANRLGTLAVVTNRGGLPETIVQGETGFVAEVSPDDLAMKIKQAIKSKKRRESVRDASLSKLNPRNSVDALLKFFESM